MCPGLTVNDFGKLSQYGSYDLGVYYTSPTGPGDLLIGVHAPVPAE